MKNSKIFKFFIFCFYLFEIILSYEAYKEPIIKTPNDVLNVKFHLDAEKIVSSTFAQIAVFKIKMKNEKQHSSKEKLYFKGNLALIKNKKNVKTDNHSQLAKFGLIVETTDDLSLDSEFKKANNLLADDIFNFFKFISFDSIEEINLIKEKKNFNIIKLKIKTSFNTYIVVFSNDITQDKIEEYIQQLILYFNNYKLISKNHFSFIETVNNYNDLNYKINVLQKEEMEMQENLNSFKTNYKLIFNTEKRENYDETEKKVLEFLIFNFEQIKSKIKEMKTLYDTLNIDLKKDLDILLKLYSNYPDINYLKDKKEEFLKISFLQHLNMAKMRYILSL